MSKSIVKVARVNEVLDEVRKSGAVTVEGKLEVLFEYFHLAARTIDPSIQRAYVLRDVVLENKPAAIHFERKGQFGQSGGAA